MTPIAFPEANQKFGAPPGYAESQVATIPAYVGQLVGGSCDGVQCVVVAWRPTDEELAAINAGSPIFLTCLGGLPAHVLTTDFKVAINPR